MFFILIHMDNVESFEWKRSRKINYDVLFLLCLFLFIEAVSHTYFVVGCFCYFIFAFTFFILFVLFIFINLFEK